MRSRVPQTASTIVFCVIGNSRGGSASPTATSSKNRDCIAPPPCADGAAPQYTGRGPPAARPGPRAAAMLGDPPADGEAVSGAELPDPFAPRPAREVPAWD